MEKIKTLVIENGLLKRAKENTQDWNTHMKIEIIAQLSEIRRLLESIARNQK